jgi:hypothetical protein
MLTDVLPILWVVCGILHIGLALGYILNVSATHIQGSSCRSHHHDLSCQACHAFKLSLFSNSVCVYLHVYLLHLWHLRGKSCKAVEVDESRVSLANLFLVA